MTRQNSGWLFETLDTAFEVSFSSQSKLSEICSGENLRNGVAATGLALDNADYYIERLMIWGQVFYTPNVITANPISMAHVRVGTLDRAHDAEVEENVLFATEPTELWGRVLQEAMVPAYRYPQWAFDGAALVTTNSEVATNVRPIFGMFGESRFHMDIQSRFSLQREEDHLVIGISPAPNYLVGGDEWTLFSQVKALVKEYRK